LIAILGVAAVVLDGGLLLDQRRRVQAAADAAALAAADDLFANFNSNGGTDPEGTAKASALSNAAANGYANDGKISIVTVNIPPKSGIAAGRSGYAEVIIQYNQKRGFSGIFGTGDIAVLARSVARGTYTHLNSGILVRDPHAPKALDVAGNGSVVVTGGASLNVNSDSMPNAAIAEGNGNVSAPTINITGGFLQMGNGRFIGAIKTSASPAPDPLIFLPAPNPNTLILRSSSQVQISGNSSLTLNPGVYRRGIAVSDNGSVTLNAGIYYLDGGGFSVSGNGSVIGNGVMIYNAPRKVSDVLDFAGNGNLDITPITSGVYQGISLFQDRNSAAKLSITGNGGLVTSVLGTIYAANALFTISGNGGLDGSQVVVNQLKVVGDGDFNVKYSSSNTARVRLLGLVE
jgi:hypothetical protein